MKIIGITGGIGSGKSEVLTYIKEHCSCRIEFADLVARRIQEPGQACYEKIVALFGKEILQENGYICREKMAEKLFADKGLLEKVNGIIHPAVKEYLLAAIEDEKKNEKFDYFFIEAALLIEEGYEKIVDELWYVYATKEVRKKRLHENRGYSAQKIISVMGKQLDENEFRKHCSFVIDNSGSLEQTYKQIDRKLGADR